jgi:hypothetical protein
MSDFKPKKQRSFAQKVPQDEAKPEKYKSYDYEDGIVGLHNNTYYCYMNACL